MRSTPTADHRAYRRLPRWAASVAGAVAVALAVAVGAGGVWLLSSDDASRPSPESARSVQAVAGPAAAPFRLAVPRGWVVRDQARPGWDGSTPMVSLRRADGRGSLRLRVGGRLEPSLVELRSVLRSRIPAQVEGARVVTSRRVEVGAGEALLTLWINPANGRVQSNLVIPAGRRSYVLNAVVEAGAEDAAREVGAIFSAFRTDAR